MAQKRRDRTQLGWQYGPEEILYYRHTKSLIATEVKFISPADHQQFRVSICGHWHTFKYKEYRTWKARIFDEPWIRDPHAYNTLMTLAKNVTSAVFKGFQPKWKGRWAPIEIHGEKIKLDRMWRGYLIFEWKKQLYELDTINGRLGIGKLGIIEPEGAETVPELVRWVLMVMAPQLWRCLPEYKTWEEREAERQAKYEAKMLAQTKMETLFRPEEVPIIIPKRPPPKKAAPKKQEEVPPLLVLLHSACDR